MDQLVLEVGPDTTIHIQQIGGDLRLTGWDQNQFFAEAEDDGSLKLDRGGEPLTLVAASDATVRVPRGAQVIIETVGGDAQIKGLEGRLHVRMVGGDLRLRQTADTNIERVGGDISAKKVNGYLRVA